MPIEFKNADMFTETKRLNAQAIVNTVNCVGVMGKGIALEFKKRWKDNYTAYKKLCSKKELSPGKMFIFENKRRLDDAEPQFIINFPTKDHWRSDSKIEFIKDGLDALVQEVKAKNIKSVVMPALGCGNGGLDWKIVKPIIQSKLADLAKNNVQIAVIEPKITFEMNFERAVLLCAISEISTYLGTLLKAEELHGIIYILQTYGAKFNLKFSKGRNAPYSPAIDKICQSLRKAAIINQIENSNGIELADYGKETLEKYLNYHTKEHIKSTEIIAIFKEKIYSKKREFFMLPILIHWLQKMKGKDKEEIRNILYGKSLKKILSKKPTEQDIENAFIVSTQKIEPIAWSLEHSPYPKVKYKQPKRQKTLGQSQI